MTTEDDLQKEIDANPEEVALRGVVADLIEETGDPRNMGYRALSRLGRRPCLRSDQPGYHFGGGLTSWRAGEIHPRNSWALQRYNDLSKEYAMRKSPPFHPPQRIDHKGIGWFDLPANPIHSLPRVWFNACWNEWWDSSEEQLPWVMLKTRRELDDFVAKAFLNTPEPFRDHVLNCPLPVEFPFWFNCPECNGAGYTRAQEAVKIPLLDRFGEPIQGFSKPSQGNFALECFRCHCKGKFREDYGVAE